MIVFFGFRGYVLLDWHTYSRSYDNSPTLFDNFIIIEKFLNNGWEKGFLVYMIICKTISSNYLFFQFISFIIDYIIIFYFFKRVIPENVILCLVFFILFNGILLEFHLLRNIKGILLFILSIKYIEKRIFSKFFLINIVGALFHISSLLFIPMFFILNKKIPGQIIFIAFLVGNLLFLLRVEWLKYFLSNISIPGRLGDIIYKYLTATSKYSQAFVLSIGYLERCFSFLLVFYFSKKIIKTDKNNNIYINAFYIYIFIYIFFYEMFIFIERVAVLFVFSYWIVYPMIYATISKRKKYIFILILLFYGILKFGSGYNKYYFYYDNVLFPYKSIKEREYILKTNNEYLINRNYQ
jgi:hypothetical protein